MMLYFVLFCGIGLLIGFIIKKINFAIATIVVISVCWAFVYGPWALATFVELMLGFAVARVILKEMKGGS